ncbi:hypothetical protein [Streptomyces sp. NPDC012888]|uniref:hypothetical protein n=1 Tax=Streptomyces sp. NPDC012888 TaxID=3364855 RepID=UPI00368E4859
MRADEQGMERIRRIQARRQRPRRMSVTVGAAVLLPVLLTGSAWLAQPVGVVWPLLATAVSLTVLCTAWVLSGAWPGAVVAVSGIAFTLFLGPALENGVLEQRGVRVQAVVTEAERYDPTKGPDRYTCRVATAAGESYELGCEARHTKGFPVTVVVDPQDWLGPRLAERSGGPSAPTLAVIAGLFAVMEAAFLFGRLRKRPDARA